MPGPKCALKKRFRQAGGAWAEAPSPALPEHQSAAPCPRIALSEVLSADAVSGSEPHQQEIGTFVTDVRTKQYESLNVTVRVKVKGGWRR